MSLTVYISEISFFTHISDISIVYLEQVNDSWVAFFVSFAQKFTIHNAWEMSSIIFNDRTDIMMQNILFSFDTST